MRLHYNVGSFGRLENGIPTSGHVSHRCDNISNSKRQTSTVKIKELFIKLYALIPFRVIGAHISLRIATK